MDRRLLAFLRLMPDLRRQIDKRRNTDKDGRELADSGEHFPVHLLGSSIVPNSFGNDYHYFSAASKAAPVLVRTSSRLTLGCSSISTRPPPGFTSNTARSVMIRLTTPLPVIGSVHSFKIFGLPSLEVCSISAPPRFTPATRSIAPPGPFTILPGIIQFAMSPLSVTSKAPRMARSICPPRI